MKHFADDLTLLLLLQDLKTSNPKFHSSSAAISFPVINQLQVHPKKVSQSYVFSKNIIICYKYCNYLDLFLILLASTR